ncbi:MAG: DNA polymerase III subunit delta [Bacteroidales bacterium]
MTAKEIYNELKNKIYRPVYLFTGQEPYYIDRLTDFMINKILTEEEKAFNQTVLYGKDTDAATVINAARRFPMMSNHQLIVVKEAQQMKDIDDLFIYVKNPLNSTILVINYKYNTYDKRKKLYKAVQECNGALLESSRLYENKIPDWITSWLRNKKCSIEPSACMLLVEYLGTDLGKIENELEKLILALPENDKKVTTLSIERNIGISKDYNNFELQKALGQKNVLKANRIINYFAKNPKDNPFTLTITSLFFYFSKIFTLHFLKDKSKKNIASALKINPYFVSEYEQASKKYNPRKTALIISWLREYDMRSKGFGNSSASDGDLLKELVYKILH